MIPTGPGLDEAQQPFLLEACWAGNGSALYMVHDYDVYYRPTVAREETYRVTKSAVPGVVYNGVPDWLYEGKFRTHT